MVTRPPSASIPIENCRTGSCSTPVSPQLPRPASRMRRPPPRWRLSHRRHVRARHLLSFGRRLLNESDRVSRRMLKLSRSLKPRLQGGPPKDLSGSSRGGRSMAGLGTRCGEHPLGGGCAGRERALILIKECTSRRSLLQAPPISGVTGMSETSSFEQRTRREAFSLLARAAALELAPSGIFLFGTEASARPSAWNGARSGGAGAMSGAWDVPNGPNVAKSGAIRTST
jgi:hypothetical protein